MDTITEILPCIGVVLAGGLSSRMGRDKALLPWQGRPLIERQLATLKQADVTETRVAGDRPDYGGIADAWPHAGPLGGLDGIARAIAGNIDLLVIPVDMPLLQPPLLRRLRCEHPGARSLSFVDHVLPLRLRLDNASRAMLQNLMQQDDPRQRSLRALQVALNHQALPLDASERAQLADCNTATQWNEVTG
jgi:molybdopterin-guanine dinucleotide biosynthesis protein A